MAESIQLAFVGDVMCGDSFYLMGNGTATMIDRYEEDFIPPEVVDILKSHDMVMGNVECVLSDVGRKENNLRRLHMRGRPRTADLLRKWGFTVANLANNHILEQGQAAAVDTAKNLKEVGIEVIGAGAGHAMERGIESQTLDLKGLRAGLLGICLRDEKYAYDGGVDVDEAVQAIEKCKETHDLVILSVHWGQELIDYPNVEQRQLARRFQQAGADLIIGHHPHVMQGIDQIDSSLIAYSLGNFIFDGYSKLTRWSAILSVTIDADKTISYETIPVLRGKDFRPQLSREKDSDLLGLIQQRNQLCRQEITDIERYKKEYQEQVDRLCQNSRKALWKGLAKRLFTFKPIYWPQLLYRPIQRRLGTW